MKRSNRSNLAFSLALLIVTVVGLVAVLNGYQASNLHRIAYWIIAITHILVLRKRTYSTGGYVLCSVFWPIASLGFFLIWLSYKIWPFDDEDERRTQKLNDRQVR